MAPRTTPTVSAAASGSPRGVMKPSVRPAMTNHGAVPSTSSTAGRAAARSDRSRGSSPGSITARARRSPAAPATEKQESSRIPWGTT